MRTTETTKEEKQMEKASQGKEGLCKKRWCNQQGNRDTGGIEDCIGFEMGCY